MKYDRLNGFWSDTRGGAVVEFAILAPLLFVMLAGILVMGFQLQSYNAVRSAAADTGRYTVIEYQKSNKLTETQIEDVAIGIAGRSPYRLAADRLDVSATKEATAISGASKFTLTFSYTPHDLVGFAELHPPTITYSKSVVVPD